MRNLLNKPFYLVAIFGFTLILTGIFLRFGISSEGWDHRRWGGIFIVAGVFVYSAPPLLALTFLLFERLLGFFCRPKNGE